MLFNSYPFLFLFLPIALAGFFLLALWQVRAAAVWLVMASLFFYGWWDVRFLAVLAPSVLFNYLAGRRLGALARAGRDRPRRWLLFAAVTANLALLGYFKYANFFVGSVTALLGGGQSPFNIVLPLGISFFTFTQIAFLVDAARGEVDEFDFVHYSLFVTYFPHLIAGPILHHREMMPQFRSPSKYIPTAENFAAAVAYLSLGLAKKCLIADSFAPDASFVFQSAHHGDAIGAVTAWRGAIAYTLQLYFDFSGYCDMGMGVSRMFGMRMPFNFNSPYQAVGIIDFWRRWHMTLSRFLRDYLYFPLGGNRRGPRRRYVNLMVTMLLGGLWHGANWTFVLWGGLHGLYLIVNHSWQAMRPAAALSRVPSVIRIGVSVAVTFSAVVVAWVVFRAPDAATAGRLLAAMAGANGLHPVNAVSIPVSLTGGFEHFNLSPKWGRLFDMLFYATTLAIVFALPNTQQLIEGNWLGTGGSPAPAQRSRLWRSDLAWGVAIGAIGVMAIMSFTRTSEFLYFQF